jgi:hypothetical protein
MRMIKRPLGWRESQSLLGREEMVRRILTYTTLLYNALRRGDGHPLRHYRQADDMRCVREDLKMDNNSRPNRTSMSVLVRSIASTTAIRGEVSRDQTT